MNELFYGVIYKEIVTEFIVIKNMTAVSGAELFRSEIKSSGFHANKVIFASIDQISCL